MISINEKNFKQEVIESSIPVIVSFWAPWCGVCRLVEPVLSQIQANAAASLKVVKVNADENFNLARHYRLTTLPTLLLFESGEVTHRLDPQLSRGDLHTSVMQILEPFNRQPCLQQD